MGQFHICTIANDPVQYQQLMESLADAGFNSQNSRISLFENFENNRFEPYSVINSILNNSSEPYVILCHQDIRFNQGDGYPQLVSRLHELDQRDLRWVVAGNAGVNPKFKYVVRISDSNNSPNWNGSFPQSVFSLDENFLVFKNTKRAAAASNDLAGFHLYGSDVCLHAIKNGGSCYVIDFHLAHLSGGNTGSEFQIALKNFYAKWSTAFSFCYHKTMTGKYTCFSRHKWARSIGSIGWVRKTLLFLNRYYPFLAPH